MKMPVVISQKELDKMGCENKDCSHADHQLEITMTCNEHRGPVNISYCRATGLLSIECYAGGHSLGFIKVAEK